MTRLAKLTESRGRGGGEKQWTVLAQSELPEKYEDGGKTHISFKVYNNDQV